MTEQPQWQRMPPEHELPDGIPRDPFFGAMRVCSSISGMETWHVYLVQYDEESGDLYDPASQDRIGWNLSDLDAWCPAQIPDPPSEDWFD